MVIEDDFGNIDVTGNFQEDSMCHCVADFVRITQEMADEEDDSDTGFKQAHSSLN